MPQRKSKTILITTKKGNCMKVLALALIAITIAGCDNQLFGTQEPTRGEILQAVVRASLKDPDSAKFGNVMFVNDSKACVGVNAKNSLGGYTGEQQAMLIESEGRWQVIEISDISQRQCFENLFKVK